MSRFGGFRLGRFRLFKQWADRVSPSASSAPVPTAVTDFDYTTAQGIWSLNSTMQFPKKGNLYSFTSFTFTNGGQTGYGGPSLSTLLSNYDTGTYPWLSNTDFFAMTHTGIQQWTVPASGTYTIRAAGAQGGYHSAYVIYGGYGADHQIDVYLEKEEVLNIVVGQAGVYGGSSAEGTGGGGGTFVYTGAVGGTGLIIASGGGGGTDDGTTTVTQPDGEITGGDSALQNLNPTLFSGGTEYTNNGQDGYFNGGSYEYGPGAGWLNDYDSRVGKDFTYSTQGFSKSTGNRGGTYFEGGTYYSTDYAGGSWGGFGGGGANFDDGGAGGGFTGGSTTSSAGGGAGGSYYAGMTNAYYTSDWNSVASNYQWNGTNGNMTSTPAHGFVIITKV